MVSTPILTPQKAVPPKMSTQALPWMNSASNKNAKNQQVFEINKRGLVVVFIVLLSIVRSLIFWIKDNQSQPPIYKMCATQFYSTPDSRPGKAF